MNVVKIVFWEDDGAWLGYLQDYPDYWTQGETLDALKEHLKDLYLDLIGGFIPGIRKYEFIYPSHSTPVCTNACQEIITPIRVINAALATGIMRKRRLLSGMRLNNWPA
jgi:predicted RNase H-like HicB family nuclease